MSEYRIVLYINHAYFYNLSTPPCYLTTAVLNDCYSEVTANTALAYSLIGLVSMTHMDVYITPTNDLKFNILYSGNFWQGKLSWIWRTKHHSPIFYLAKFQIHYSS